MDIISTASPVLAAEYDFRLSIKIIIKGIPRNNKTLMFPESKKMANITWEQNHIIMAFDRGVKAWGDFDKKINIIEQHPAIIIAAIIARRRVVVFSLPIERIAVLSG